MSSVQSMEFMRRYCLQFGVTTERKIIFHCEIYVSQFRKYKVFVFNLFCKEINHLFEFESNIPTFFIVLFTFKLAFSLLFFVRCPIKCTYLVLWILIMFWDSWIVKFKKVHFYYIMLYLQKV